MWILQIFKDALNASFDYFLEKIKGRFWAFLVQLIVSYLAVAFFTLVITTVIISLLNQGKFSLDLFTAEGLFEWMRMIDPVWLITAVIAVNFMFKTDLLNKRMSFPDFYANKSSQFWLDLVVAIAIVAVGFTIYYKNELLLSYNYDNNLELLLDAAFENDVYSISGLISNWISYIVVALPVVAVLVIEFRDRKRSGFQLKISFWKILLATILFSFILTLTFNYLAVMFSELILALLYVPFEMIEIPVILGVFSSIFFKTLHFIALTAFFHFVLQLNMERVTTEVIDNTTNELLDI